MTKKGSLMVVGSGIKSIGHVTLEAQGWIARADKVLYAVADPATEIWIKRAHPDAEDLVVHYRDDTKRIDTYHAMTAAILRHVRAGLDVCAVFYGHPGVFVRPSHDAVRIARAEGYRAGMLPAVSALDCLFADLGIDPADAGCQMFEATDYLLHRRRLSTDCHIILWQIGAVGDPGHSSAGYDARNLPLLVGALQEVYGQDYDVVHYQAAKYPLCPALIQRMPLSRLVPRMVSAASTLYVPPKDAPHRDPAMARQLYPAEAPAARTPGREAIPYRPSVAASRLADFLAELAQDPRLLARYARDPGGTLARYGGLTEAERAAVLSRQPGRLRHAMLDEGRGRDTRTTDLPGTAGFQPDSDPRIGASKTPAALGCGFADRKSR